MSSLSRFQTTTNSLLNWVFQDKDAVIKGKPSFVFDMFADHLSAAYEEWLPFKKKENLKLAKFTKKDYERKDLEFILEIRKEIEKSMSFSYFLIHGSCADLNVVPGWSDFDAIGILKSESLSRENRYQTFETCQKIDKMMRVLDPYQHHGIHFVHEKEMSSFPSLYLPVNLLRDSKCLLGNKSITVGRVDSSSQEMSRFRGIVKTLEKASETGVLKHHAKDGKYLLENYEDPNTMYQLKYLMCVVMLLPTLWLNLQENYCQKSESYDLIRAHFSGEDLEFLEACSSARFGWKKSYHVGNTIPDQVKKTLGTNYLVRAAKFAKLLESRLGT